MKTRNITAQHPGRGGRGVSALKDVNDPRETLKCSPC